MTKDHRFFQNYPTWFFTVNLAERQNNQLLVDKIDTLRSAFSYVKLRKRFRIHAVVIMPDHLHTIWTLPPEDSEFSFVLEGVYPDNWGCMNTFTLDAGE